MKLKALILAGGFGTRLRPLSCTRPKLLFPVLNKPILDWTLERLAEGGVTEVILAVNYMADALMQRYGNSERGMRIVYSSEKRPLGTGGPIKNAEGLIGHDDPFLVLNGDILTDIDYAELAQRHVRDNVIATISLCEVDDPSRYGIADISEGKRITQFVEKPPRDEAPTNLANAGIYVLNPEIFSYIPGKRAVSLEQEIFPILAREGELCGYHFEGLWIDIGKLSDYIRANRLLLDLDLRHKHLRNNMTANVTEIHEPSMLGNGVTVGERSSIGPYTVIGNNTKLGKAVRIENSLIFPNSLISDFASIDGSVIGEDVSIGRRVRIADGCVIGDHTRIKDRVTLHRDVAVCPFKEISKSVSTAKCLM